MTILILLFFILNSFAVNVSKIWNFETKGAIIASPTVGDIDEDGQNEIVFCSSGESYIYVIKAAAMQNYRSDMVKWSESTEDGTDFFRMFHSVNKEITFAYRFQTNSPLVSSPVLEDLTGDGTPDIIAIDQNGNIYILDFRNKVKYDMFPSKTAVTTSPALGDFNNDNYRDIVFGGTNGMVLIYDGKNKRVINRTNIDSPINMSPCLYDVNKDGQLDIIIGGDNGKVKALNGKNLSQIWEYEKPNSQIFSSPSLFKVGGKDYIILGFNDYRFAAVDAQTGKLFWNFTTNNHVIGSPICINVNPFEDKDDDVIISSNDTLYALNGKTGKPIWEKTAPKVIMTPLVYDLTQNGKLDLIYGGEIGTLTVLNLATGKPDADITFVTDQLQSIQASPILADINGDEILEIVVGCNDGNLYAFQDPSKENKVDKNIIIFESYKGEPSYLGRVEDIPRLRNKNEEELRKRKVAFLFDRSDKWLAEEKFREAAMDLETVIELDKEKRFPTAKTKLNTVKSQYINLLLEDCEDHVKTLNLQALLDSVNRIEKLGPEGDQLTELMKYKESIKELEKKQEDALTGLKNANSLIAKHNLPEAYKLLKEAEKKSPFNEDIKNAIKKIEPTIQLFEKAQELENNKKWKEALINYTQIKKTYPNFPEIDSKIKTLKLRKNALPGIIILVALVILVYLGLKFKKTQDKKKIEQQKAIRAAQRKKREAELGEIAAAEETPEPTITAEIQYATDDDDVETSPATQSYGEDYDNLPEDAPETVPEASVEEEVKQGEDLERDLDHGKIPDSGSTEAVEEDWGLTTETPETQTEEKISEDVIEKHQTPKPALEIGSDLELANIENRYNMAQKLIDDGEFDRAIEEYLKISEIESKFKLLSLAQIGICYLKKGEKIKAMGEIKKIPYNDVNIDPEIRKEVLLHLAHEFEKNNLLKSAIGMYKLAIPLTQASEKKAILYKIGNLFQENGLTQEAIAAYKELYLIDSQYRDVAERLDNLGI